MTPVTALTVELAPIEDTLTPELDAIFKRTMDMLPAYEAIYAEFHKIEAKRFSAEGPGWTSLAASTQAERARMGIGASNPILDRTGASYDGRRGGALKRSLTELGDSEAVFTPEIDGVFMGTKDPIATYHQDGTDKMPARPVVDMTTTDAATFAGIIGEYVFGGKKGTLLAGGAVFAAGSLGL